MATEKSNARFSKTRYIVWLSVLLAFVIILQVFGSYIKIGATNISLVLVPIVLGGILLGPMAGLYLGFAFSLTVMIMGFVGADGFTNVLLNSAPLGTLLTIFIKGIAAGVIPAIVYKAIAKKNKTAGVFVSALLAPILNTGLFIVCMLFIGDVISEKFLQSGQSVLYFLVVVCAGVNFLVELAVNVILAPVLNRVATVINGRI